MSKILVTGGAGFIGSSLAEKIAQNPNNQVVVVDNLLTGKQENVPESSNVKFIKADVNKLDEISSVFISHHFDYIYHYAAVVGVQRTLAHPVAVLRDIDGIHNVLDLSKDTQVKRIFF